MKIIFAATLFILVPNICWSCMPSIPSGASLKYFPEPKFSKQLKFKAKAATVIANVWISKARKVERIENLETVPEGLPLEPIKKSFMKAQFFMLNGVEVSNEQIEVDFPLVNEDSLDISNLELDISVDIDIK